MSGRLFVIWDQLRHRRDQRWWRQAVGRAEQIDLFKLRGIRTRARELQRQLDQVLHVADGRLTLPLIGANAMERPLHSDWVWRPEIWRGPINPRGMTATDSRTAIGTEVTLYHDCKVSELTLRQVRNTREDDLAPFGLKMDVFRFDGSFLSLVIELPKDAVNGLRRNHLVRIAASVELEQPLEIFTRLNILHGPNTEQLVREIPAGKGDMVVDFDLAYSNLNEKRVERAWIDLIFEGPEMNQVILRDVTLSRRPRAEF